VNNLIKQVSDGVWVAAVWLSEWDTYMNCYLIRNEEGYCLIDTASKEQRKDIINLFSSINLDISEIHTVIASHWHPDHTGNIGIFENARKFIHRNDIGMIEEDEQHNYEIFEGESGVLNDFQWRLLGIHTPGSIGLYHKGSKTYFAGDVICLFDTPLPEDGLISRAECLREKSIDFIKSGEYSKGLRKKMLEPQNYIDIMKALTAYDIDYLCTGHGVVLKEQISDFLNQLADSLT